MEVLLPILFSLPPAAMSAIFIALVLGAAVAAITFMIGYFLQNPQMIALAREELSAWIFTILIIFFWLSLDTVLNGISNGLLVASLPKDASIQSIISSTGSAGGLTSNHITLALASTHVIIEKLMEQYKSLYLFEALIGFLSTISFPIGSPIPAVNIISLSLAPFTGLVLLSNAHTVIVEAIGYLITVMWTKEFILYFARDAVPLLLLPLGLILRAIPFFRMTGSSILAMCFALYFVLPFALLLSNYMIFDVFNPADFTYTPKAVTNMGTTLSAGDVQNQINNAEHGTEVNELVKQFTSPDLVQQAYGSSSACSSTSGFFSKIFCSTSTLVKGTISAAKGVFSTMLNMGRFMVSLTGDFFYSLGNNPLMPASTSAGLFYFIISEVTTLSPFIVLIILSIFLEIVIVVTAYRAISLAIGGEAEIAGLTKVI